MRFLVLFRGTRQTFREAEFQSLIRLVRGRTNRRIDDDDAGDVLIGVQGVGGGVQQHLHGDVFKWVTLRSEEEAKKIAARSVLVRAIFRVWGIGDTYSECLESALLADESHFSPLLHGGGLTFKCVVEAFGRAYSLDEQLQKMHFFAPILSKFEAKVKLKNPDHEVWIMEDAFPTKGHRHKSEALEEPRKIFFALKVADGGQGIVQSYTLKKRKYIGTTSMDAELSFIMANQALLQEGSIVMDPFVGTGSIIVSAAAFGASVIGSDIDINVLRGKDSASISSNFEQYGLNPPLAIVRADILRSPWRKGPWLDAVLCDPPYGIREGSRSFREYDVPDALKAEHIPSTQRVRFTDHLCNLLDFSARNLVLGGRLVFWLPTTMEFRKEDIPAHPAFHLVSDSEQILTWRFRRRLLTMEKMRELGESELKSAFQELALSATDTDVGHADLAAKILRQDHRKEGALASLVKDD